MYLIDTMVLSELRRRQRSMDAALAEELATWLKRLLHLHPERLLAVDLPVARRWGQLSAALGHDSADLLIAASPQAVWPHWIPGWAKAETPWLSSELARQRGLGNGAGEKRDQHLEIRAPAAGFSR